MKKHLFLLIFLSLLALWPFFKKGFFKSHDGEWMIIRFTAFHQTLTAGQSPVRFVDRLNNNYGYPVINFLYPLPFYTSEIWKVLGFGYVDSIKITFIASTVLSVIAMFWALSQHFAKQAALVGSIVYLYIPYRFVDLYVRGSIGENLAFAILPLILGSILKLKKAKGIYWPILTLAIALLILAHNVIAVLFIPLFLAFALSQLNSKIKTTMAFLLGFTIASFFWLPAINDLKFVRLSQIKVSHVSEHLVPVKDLLIPRWGYGPSPQSQDGLSIQIGLVTIFIIAAMFYLLIKNRNKSKTLWSLIILVILSGFLMTNLSLPLWQKLPYIDIIQFPWRLMSVIVFGTSLLAAQLVTSAKNDKILVYLIILASFLTTITYTRPAEFVDRPDSYYATNEDTTTVQNEYMPLWVREIPKDRANKKIEAVESNIKNLIIKPAKYQAVIETPKDTEVKVNAIYFPGWQAQVDGQKVAIDFQNPNGLITFGLPKGVHKVIIEYKNSGIHLVSEIISGLTLALAGSYFIYKWRKQNS